MPPTGCPSVALRLWWVEKRRLRPPVETPFAARPPLRDLRFAGRDARSLLRAISGSRPVPWAVSGRNRWLATTHQGYSIGDT